MTDSSASPRKHPWARRLLFAGLTGLLSLLVLILALPWIVSSSWFLSLLTAEASRMAGRPVALERLRLAWSGQVSMEGLTVSDLPEYSPKPILEVDALQVRVDPVESLQGHLATEVVLDGLRAHIVRERDGRTNLQALLSVLGSPSATPPGEPPTSGEEAPGVALEDLAARVRLRGLEFEVDDRVQDRRAALRDGSLDLDLPSLRDSVDLRLSAALSVDGRELPEARLRVRAEHLLGSDGTLDLGDASGEAEASIPGIELRMRGASGDASLAARMEVDLAPLLEAVGAFFPRQTEGAALSGRLSLDMAGQRTPGGEMALSLALDGSGIVASGPILGGTKFGPLDLRLEVTGGADPTAGDYRAESGTLELQSNTRVAWSVSISDLGKPGSSTKVTVGPAVVDLEELSGLTAPRLLETWGVALAGPCRLRLGRGVVTGPVSREAASGVRHTVELEGLDLQFERGSFAAEELSIDARKAEVGVSKFSASVRDLMPENASLQARVRVADFRVAGPAAATVRDFDVNDLVVEVRNLEKAEGPVGYRGGGTVRVRSAWGSLDVPGFLEVKDGRQSGEMELAQDGTGRGSIVLRDLSLVLGAGAAGAGGAWATLTRVGERPAASLGLEEVRIEGALLGSRALEGDVPVRAQGLTLSVASVAVPHGAAGEGLAARVEDLNATLQDGFPRDVAVRTSLRADRFEIGTETGNVLRLAGLEVPELVFEASDLSEVPESPYGAAGRFRLRESLNLEELHVPVGAEVLSLRHSLEADGALEPDGTASFRVANLDLTADNLRAELPTRGTVRTPLRATASAEAVEVRGEGAPRIDAGGVSLEVALSDAFQATVSGGVRDLGAEDLRLSGSVRVDLDRLLDLVPADLWPGEATGIAQFRWQYAGRLPTSAETRELSGELPGFAAGRPLPFLREASLALAVEEAGADGTPGGKKVSFSGLATERDVAVVLEDGGRVLALDGALSVGRIEALPGLGKVQPPLRANLAFQGRRTPDGSVRLEQSSALDPWSVRQVLTFTLTGVDRVLRRGFTAPPSAWLGVLGGEAHGSLEVGDAPDLGALAEGLTFKGPLRADLRVRLVPGQSLTGGVDLKARKAGVSFRDRFELSGLQADVELQRKFSLREVGAKGQATTDSRLSEIVLEPEGRSTVDGAEANFGAPRYGGTSTLGFAHLQLGGLPLPVRVDGFRGELSSPGGLPAVDRFEAEVLGGAAVGSVRFVRDRTRLALEGGIAFSGLDIGALDRGTEPGRSDTDTQVSGRFSLRVPLESELPAILAGVEADAELTHIGRRSLDRALYALDPTGSNEAIVKQRDLLRHGGPRWVRAGLRSGNLSLTGEVEAAGVRLDLPRLERLNVAEIPGMESFDSDLAVLESLRGFLEAAEADTIEFDPTGAVRFVKGGGP